MIKYNLTQTLIDYEYAKKLSELPGVVKCHVKVDTGLNRFGHKAKEIETIKKSMDPTTQMVSIAIANGDFKTIESLKKLSETYKVNEILNIINNAFKQYYWDSAKEDKDI